MDFDKYLNDFHRQLEENRQRIHNGLRNDGGTSDTHHHDYNESTNLPVYKELEPESKAKLGTFERIIKNEQNFNVKAIDYATTDYAPLVNLLGGIIEEETSLSIWQLIRSNHGVKMPYYYNRPSNTSGATLKKGNETINLNVRKATLGTLSLCLDNNDEKEKISSRLKNINRISSFIEEATSIRNDASHGGYVIYEKSFKSFFEKYEKFHKDDLPSILKLKQEMKTRKKDADDSIESTDCKGREVMPTDEYIARLNTMFDNLLGSSSTTDDDSIPAELTEKTGIVLTDTNRLASKYGCDRQTVVDMLQSFISESEDCNMYWLLLDMAGAALNNSPWQFYNDHLSDFIAQKHLQCGLNLHLMIIGGQDVIPNAIYVLPEETNAIPTDMVYAFDGDYIGSFIDGCQDGIDMEDIRNTVSRLPLQDGSLSPYDINKDIGGYLSRCLSQTRGIRSRNIVMTTNKEWLSNSDDMSRNLPLVAHTDDTDITYKRMYVSPRLDVHDAESMKYFQTSCSEADTMIFNLHGSSKPGRSGFYGEDDSLAFSPLQLQETDAKIIITAACCGARYANYTREDSMLMSALYKADVLLYFGSQVNVPMFFDMERMESRRLLFGTYNGSEVLLRLLTLYLYYGNPSGRAYISAVCDYFNMYRHIESDNFALKTILMFGMYGNPMLCVQKRQKLISAAMDSAGSKGNGKCVRVPYCKTDTKTVFDRRNTGCGSMLDKLRRLVDDNFEAIRKTMEENLYNELGLPPRQLESVKNFSRKNADGAAQDGYLFLYHNPDACFSNDTMVEVNKAGKIIKVYKSKTFTV